MLAGSPSEFLPKRKKGRSSAALLVELPGIEPDALPGYMPSELPVVTSRSGSVPLVTCGFVLESRRRQERSSNPSSRYSAGSCGGGEQFLQGDLEVVGQVPYVGHQFPA